MTTIAYRRLRDGSGEMACNSCWTAFDSEQQTSEIKIFRLPGGGLLGQAGDNDGRELLTLFGGVKTEKALPTRKQLAETKTDSHSIFVLPSGKIFLISIGIEKAEWYGMVWPAGRFGFAACGSGGHLALGAMHAGANVRSAVMVACQYDINSKAPVHVVKFKPSGNGRRTKSAGRKP